MSDEIALENMLGICCRKVTVGRRRNGGWEGRGGGAREARGS
jgi:hypothetical protein